jgi:DNA-binding NtrC family response regulator
VPVIVVTGLDDVATAVQCIKAGAYDYLVKPLEEGRLVTTVRRALAFREMRQEIDHLKTQVLSGRLKNPDAFAHIITGNQAMLAACQYVESIAQTAQPVMITGETGTGKQLFAEAVHRASGRKGEMVRVNVAGLDDNMFSDTLFGHVKGAFTGADRHRPGLVEKAKSGTLFLDEIGDLAPASQVKLLDLLQNRQFLPLGQDETRLTDARIVVATNRELDDMRRSETFRRDLYYRLRAHHLNLPPLRRRLDDLPRLVEHFLAESASAMEKPKPTAPAELYDLLATYHFPGNVRELQAMVMEAVSKHTGRMLSLDSFKQHIDRERDPELDQGGPSSQRENTIFADMDALPTLKQAGELLVREAVRRANGNLSAASRVLGISRQALSKRIKRSQGD